MQLRDTCERCPGPIEIPYKLGVEIASHIGEVIMVRTDKCPNGHTRRVGILQYPPLGSTPRQEATEINVQGTCSECDESAEIRFSRVSGEIAECCPQHTPGPLREAIEFAREDG